MTEPLRDLAHLGHVELLTPRLEESVAFFTAVLGMGLSGYGPGAAYLRAFDDYEFHTLKLQEAAAPGVGHVAWRTSTPEALTRRAKALEASGAGLGWSEGDAGHGPAFRARGPAGVPIEIYHETCWHEEADAAPRGANLRRLDHLILVEPDVPGVRRLFEDALGLRATECVERDRRQVEWRLTSNNKLCDIAVATYPTPVRLAYLVGDGDDVRRAAHLSIEHGASIETGPVHPVHETGYLQVREPGGNWIEVCAPGARLSLAPEARLHVRISNGPPRWRLQAVEA